MAEIAAGTIVDGRYRILGRIGAGGMAEVYRAEDEHLGREVALKLLHRHFAEDQEFVERFRREASAAAGLQHPNVVGVYDRGEWDGTYYIAMEHLPGRSLKELIRQEAPLDPARAIDLALQVLKAARFAHKRGVIHRDLKPHNVIVDDEGRAKVTDFGIARAGASDMTQTGSIMGTAQYLSPEQAQGHAVSAQSDVYAIGIVLYEMLTGRVPFDGESAVSIALKQVSEAPVPPSAVNPGLPPELEQAVLRALEKDPARRYHDAEEFITALEGVREHLAAGVGSGQSTAELAAVGAYAATAVDPAPYVPPVPAAYAAEAYLGPSEPPPPDDGGEDPCRRRRRWPWVLLLIVVLLAAGAAAYFLTRPQQVTVPAVVGQKSTAAVDRLHGAGFGIVETRSYSPKPVGIVVSQSPKGGADADKGSTVRITISRGPRTIAIPDVVGKGRLAAKKLLEKKGFRVKLVARHDPDVHRYKVISTSPGRGVPFAQGRTVTVFWSSGPAQVSVPSLRGESLDQARADLAAVGLTLGTVTEKPSKDQEPGTVISQAPAPNSKVDKGGAVDLVVAKQSRVKVPDVTGMSSQDAVNALAAAGFAPKVSATPVATPDQDNVVQSQSPSGGQEAAQGSTVQVVVGQYQSTTTPGTGTTPSGGGTGNTGAPPTGPPQGAGGGQQPGGTG